METKFDDHIKNYITNGSIENVKTILLSCLNNKFYNLGLTLIKYFEIYFPKRIELANMLIIFNYEMKNYELCFDICDNFLNIYFYNNMNYSNNVEKIRAKCIEYVKNKYIYSFEKKINNNKIPLITFSITTCKRYDLFEKTMNSFLNCCLDHHLIDEWICVDDNSSEEDVEKMKTKYPFFKFMFKTMKQKGHPESMNIIRNMVKTPYLFHMEDDWQFFSKQNYISNCLEILCDNSKYGQCLINKNYIETENDVIIGGLLRTTESGKKYFIHEYCETPESHQQFNDKYGSNPNCAYWPHFSLRPSLIRTEIFNKIGHFNLSTSHFEMDYSYKYKNEGYLSVFLESIYCCHIGRLTSQRNDKTKLNAYDLNDEKQFSEKEIIPFSKNYNMKTVVINLERRIDRWESFKNSKEIAFLNFTRYLAVDGSKLKPTEQLQHVFEGNDYNMRQGMVGCAMTHIKLMLELVESKYDFFCIFEDDITFVPNFKDKFEHLLKNLPDKWDICYLGHHLWKQYRSDDSFYDRTKFPIIEKWDTKKSFEYSMGGTGGYLISKQGASNMLSFIEKTGMTNGIDTMQQKAADYLDIYYPKPHLIYSDCWQINTSSDTDIQTNFKSLSIPSKTRIQNMLMTYPNAKELSLNELQEKIKEEEISNVCYYLGGEGGGDFKHKCIYKINNEAIFLLPTKLKRLEKFSETLVFNKEHYISLGDNKHIFDAISNIYKTDKEYPFDLVDKMNCEIMYSWIDKIIKGKFDDYLKQLCNPETNEVEKLHFNGINCLNNKSLGIRFPHEDAAILYSKYVKKFLNLRELLLSNELIVFIHCTRYEKNTEIFFTKLYELLSTVNKNINLITINGLSKSIPNVRLININYPEQFKGDWTHENIKFDQSVFRPEVISTIEKLYK